MTEKKTMLTVAQKALWEITSQFVDRVQKPMLDKYLEMQEDENQAYLINTLITMYTTEKAKADNDEQRNINDYLAGYCNRETTQLKHSCLIHVEHYKMVIIDILQGKF